MNNFLKSIALAVAVSTLAAHAEEAQSPSPPTKEAKHPESPENGEYTVSINGLQLWYKVSGKGPVCLMPTPAWGVSSDLYLRTLKVMEKSFTVVYLDSRGTGRSGQAASPAEYTWEHLVRDLDALRNHLKQERIWLMGHSEGGMQILHFASAHPERVQGLVLLNTAAVADDEHGKDIEMRINRRKGQPWLEDAVTALNTKPKTDEELAGMLKTGMPLYWSDPKKIEDFAEDFAAVSFSAAAMEGQAASKRFPFDIRAGLMKVKAPALIVVGDDDFICSPEAALRLHLALPNSKLLMIEKCGHFPWLEQAKVFEARVPEFLNSLGLVAQ